MELNRDNYFSKEAHQEFMSVSQFKDFLFCEEMAVKKISGEWESKEAKKDFLMGHYMHAWNEGCLGDFIIEHPEIFRKDGKKRSDFVKCDLMIERIEREPLVMKSLEGQSEVIFTAELYGAKWKICIDSYNHELKIFCDLKSLKSFYDKFWENGLENVFEYRMYFLQMAIYCEIERIANNRGPGDYFEPFLGIVSKQEPPDIDLLSFVSDHESLEEFIVKQLNIVKERLPRIIDLKAGKITPGRCGKCEYCRETKRILKPTHYSFYNIT